jgi:hypothetical protein
MNASEARQKTVENSSLFTDIMSDIEQAIEDGELEVILHGNNHFHNWTPLGEAVTKVLKDREFSVAINDIRRCTTISWK